MVVVLMIACSFASKSGDDQTVVCEKNLWNPFFQVQALFGLCSGGEARKHSIG